MRDAFLPRNVVKLLDRTDETYSPLEEWQEKLLYDRRLNEAGFGGDDWVPMNVGTVEDEYAWMDEKPIAVVDPSSASGYRFTGRRKVGEAFDVRRDDHRAAAANDAIDSMIHSAWDDEG